MALIKPHELPTRVVPARTVQVVHLNCIEVRLQLDFGVQLDRKIIVESIERDRVPHRLRRPAKKALVVLLGGKALFVHTDPTAQDGYIRGRIFLNEKVYAPPAEVMMEPFGFPGRPLLEVGTCFQWLQTHEFDIGVLKEVLNGRRRSEPAES